MKKNHYSYQIRPYKRCWVLYVKDNYVNNGHIFSRTAEFDNYKEAKEWFLFIFGQEENEK